MAFIPMPPVPGLPGRPTSPKNAVRGRGAVPNASSTPAFSVLPSIVGQPAVGVAMIFSDGIPPIGFLATKRELVDASTGVVIASATAPAVLAYTPQAGDVDRPVFYRVTVALLLVTFAVSSASVSISAASGRRTNEAVAYGYGDLTRAGFGAVSLNSDFLGVTRPGMEKPISYSTAVLTTGTAAHWNTNTATTSTPTRKAALTDATYVFKVIATFADTTTEEITLTINRLAGVYTVGTADAFVTVGLTDTAIISGKIVEFAAGCDFHSIAVAGGRKFFSQWRPAVRVTVRPHDVNRMGWPSSWGFQSCQNISFDDLRVSGDLNPSGISGCYVWGRAASDTNNNSGLIHNRNRGVIDPYWYNSPDAGNVTASMRTTGVALPIGTTTIPVQGGSSTQFHRAKGVVVNDKITFPGDTTVYTVTADNITYGGTDNIFIQGGSFNISPPLAVAIAATPTAVYAIAAPNAYVVDYCDDVVCNDDYFERIRGGISGGANTNVKFVVNGGKINHFYDNVMITGITSPNAIELNDCVWMNPDRISKFIHIDALQQSYTSKNVTVKVRRCMFIQGNGSGFGQGLFARGDGIVAGVPFATDGSDASSWDVENVIVISAAVAAIGMTGGKGSRFYRIQGVPSVGTAATRGVPAIDVHYGNAMAATFAKVGSTQYFSGVTTVDKISMFSEFNNNIDADKLTVGASVKAHGGLLYSYAEAGPQSPNYGKVKVSAQYVEQNFYAADPVAALAAINYDNLSFADAVAATKAVLKPKLNGAYKSSDGTYWSPLNPDGSWATDVPYAG